MPACSCSPTRRRRSPASRSRSMAAGASPRLSRHLGRRASMMDPVETLTIETLTYDRVAKTIDHSLLRPELTLDEIREGCELAARYDVASVCARPADVELARGILTGTRVAVGTVIGFPHGANLTATKVFEAERAMADGATELDMVINIGWLRSGADHRVEADIRAVVETAHAGGAIVKVILENAYLTKDEIVRGCQDVDRVRAERRHARGPHPDARDGRAGRQGQGGRRDPDARRADRGHERRHGP